MIELKFNCKIKKDRMFKALVESAKNAKNISEPRIEITPSRIELWGANKFIPFDDIRYKETDNGIIFYTEKSGTMAELLYYHFPRTFRQDVYIIFDRETYFYSPDTFLEIKKGRVHMMKLDNIWELQYTLAKERVRDDILDMVEKSKD